MTPGPKPTALASRFWPKVRKADGCWEWLGSKNSRGYGRIYGGGFAHRVAWTQAIGAIPNGMFVCHRCDNPSCVNPDHLFLGTQRDNMRDCKAKGRNSPPPANDSYRRNFGREGEAHPGARLTAAQVRRIREVYTGRRGEQLALAREYGVSPSTVHLIVHGRKWRHAC